MPAWFTPEPRQRADAVPARGLRGARMLVLALGLVACAAGDPGHLAVESALVRAGAEPVLEVELDHDFGPTLLEALHSGVALRYVWTLQLQGDPGLMGRTSLQQFDGAIEINYRSLTRWYTLSGLAENGPLALPTIADAEAQLQLLRLPLPEPPPEGVHSARFRIALDHRALPPPLRLPAYLSGTWRRDSGWFRFDPTPRAAAAIMAP